MAKLAHDIALGGQKHQTPDKTTVTRVTVQTTIDHPSASAEIVLADPTATAKPGDKVTVALGTHGSTTLVFTGEVQTVHANLETVTVTAGSTAAVLGRMRTDAVFENESSGAVVKALADAAKVTVSTTEEGLTFPRYVIQREQSLWRHFKQLARYNGMMVYLNAKDELTLKAYAKGNGATYTYGEDVLEMEKFALQPTLDGVEVLGESPAGQGQSDEAVFWFKKEVVSGTAGKTSGNVARHTVYAARNKDLCEKIAQHLFDASQTKAHGRARVLNGEKVALGETVSFKKLPRSEHNGDYKVTAILHEWNHEEGYTTEITWEESV